MIYTYIYIYIYIIETYRTMWKYTDKQAFLTAISGLLKQVFKEYKVPKQTGMRYWFRLFPHTLGLGFLFLASTSTSQSRCPLPLTD